MHLQKGEAHFPLPLEVFFHYAYSSKWFWPEKAGAAGCCRNEIRRFLVECEVLKAIVAHTSIAVRGGGDAGGGSRGGGHEKGLVSERGCAGERRADERREE